MSASPPADPRPHDVLFVGDVHLGRRPVGLEPALARFGLTPAELSPAAALGRLVDHALEHPPRAVVFAGDLVDQEEDRFEALGILERQVRRLAEADTPVLAVAGNHDGLVLPRLVDLVPGASLVGKGGTWERIELPGPGPDVDLFGWSFPTSHVTGCPLDLGDYAAAAARARTGAFRLGVLHGDLDAGRSRYGPVPRARLVETGLDAWFLGHVHKPSDLSGEVPIGYLGSLTGLRATETGPRGPWRVGFDGGRAVARQHHLGPLRWESLTVTLDPDAGANDLALRAALRAELERRMGSDPTLTAHELVVARVELVGELPDRSGVRAFLEDRGHESLDLELAGLRVVVQHVTDATRRPVDLAAHAKEPTPIGRLARQILDLRSGRADELIERAATEVRRVESGGWNLDPEENPLPSTASLLERAAWRLLDALLAQREGFES